MLTVENSWALLDGAQAPKEVVMKKVRVVRNFHVDGHMYEPSDVVAHMPDALANELITSNKAVLVTEEVEETYGTGAEVAAGEGHEDVQVLNRRGIDASNGEPR